MEIFQKVLTTFDVERNLLVSGGWLPDLTRSKGCLQVKDEAGILWKFGGMIRSGVAQQLVIVSGWFQFVSSKQLHPGDVISFYREDDMLTGARYKIEVKKKSKKTDGD